MLNDRSSEYFKSGVNNILLSNKICGFVFFRFELMFLCWKYKPKQRPTFKEIIEMLVPDLHVSFQEKSYFFSDEHRQEVLDYGDFEDTNQDNSNVPFLPDGDSEGATGGD